jgi:hypothetical protein
MAYFPIEIPRLVSADSILSHYPRLPPQAEMVHLLKEKELAIKEKEVAIKEKEIAFREKELAGQQEDRQILLNLLKRYISSSSASHMLLSLYPSYYPTAHNCVCP